MKNFIKYLGFMAFALMVMLVMPVWSFAQNVVDDVVGSAILPGIDAGSYFASFSTLAGLVIFISAWVNKTVNLKGFLKQFTSWLLSIILAFVGWLLGLGMFEGIQWWLVVVYGISTGLVANGLFDTPAIQSLLIALKLEKKKK